MFSGDKDSLFYCNNNFDNLLINSFLNQVINKNEIEQLITAGANIKAISEDGDSILDEVIAYQDYTGVNLGTIQYLIDLGVDINNKVEGINCLFMAYLTGSKDLVELLIKNGADVNCVSTDTPESLLNLVEFDSGEYNNIEITKKMEEIVSLLRNYGAKFLSEIEKEKGKKWNNGIMVFSFYKFLPSDWKRMDSNHLPMFK